MFQCCQPSVKIMEIRNFRKNLICSGPFLWSQRGLLRNFYFSGKMRKIFPNFFYQTISMNHHITKTAKEVLCDFLTEIAPLTNYSPRTTHADNLRPFSPLLPVVGGRQCWPFPFNKEHINNQDQVVVWSRSDLQPPYFHTTGLETSTRTTYNPASSLTPPP